MIKLEGMEPKVHKDTFLASGSKIIGNVTIKAGASIWYNAVLRAEFQQIIIGENTNIQDNCTIHISSGHSTIIGDRVTVGHGAIIHGCTIGDNTLIGMGAIILDGTVIGKNSVVAAGTLIPPNKAYPDNSLIMGAPGQVVRSLTQQEVEKNLASAVEYQEIWRKLYKNLE